MKRIIALLICAFVLLSSVACKTVSKEASNSTDSAIVSTTETNPIETAPTQNAPIGGSDHCEFHYESFHSIPQSLIEYVGEDEFQNWHADIDEEDALVYPEGNCSNFTIKRFIDDFEIPRDVFENYFYVEAFSNTVHDSSTLYSDDMNAIEAYYRDINARTITTIKHVRMNDIKLFLIELCYNKTLSEIWATPEEDLTDFEKEVFDTRKVSLMRVIQLLGADRSKFEQALEKTNELVPLYGIPDYDYQLDLVYNEDGSLKDFTIDDNLSVVEQDALFAGVDNFFTD